MAAVGDGSSVSSNRGRQALRGRAAREAQDERKADEEGRGRRLERGDGVWSSPRQPGLVVGDRARGGWPGLRVGLGWSEWWTCWVNVRSNQWNEVQVSSAAPGRFGTACAVLDGSGVRASI